MTWYVCRMLRSEEETGQTVWDISVREPISREEHRALSDALAHIEEENEQEGLNLVRSRLVKYVEYAKGVRDEFERLRGLAWNPLRRMTSELRGYLFDWLQAIRAYLDHTEARLKGRYGRSSEEAQRFKEVCSNFFDQSFAYRLFYKLRNAQHVDFAPVDISVKTASAAVGVETWASLVFHREELLSMNVDWGIVRRDIESLPESFGIEEWMTEMMECLTSIAREVGNIEEAFLKSQIQVLDRLRSMVPEGPGSIVAAELPDPPGSPLRSIRMTRIPEVRWQEFTVEKRTD